MLGAGEVLRSVNCCILGSASVQSIECFFTEAVKGHISHKYPCIYVLQLKRGKIVLNLEKLSLKTN